MGFVGEHVAQPCSKKKKKKATLAANLSFTGNYQAVISMTCLSTFL